MGATSSGGDARPRLAVRFEPVTIRKAVDKTTPLLVKALTNGEAVDRADFRFFRQGPAGERVHHYSITLEGGRIRGIQCVKLLKYTKHPN